MTAGSRGLPTAFRGALIASAALHVGLIILIVASPSFSRSQPKGLVQYVNFIGSGGGPGGGGGGGGAAAKPTPLPPAKKESLRDLTTALKAQPEDKASLHYPAEKPKTTKKTPEKKTAISKPAPKTAEPEAVAEKAAGQESGQGGFGLRFGKAGGTGGGTGTGPGGLGGGGTGGDPFGVSGFPFDYYLQIISDRISTNWFSSLVDPGVSGQFQAQVGFRIYRNGQVADLKVEVPSGVEAFDLSAQRAIQSSAPFPPLPSEYDGQFLVIHLIFEHSK